MSYLDILRYELLLFFFLNDPAPTEISTLPLHAALPISGKPQNQPPSPDPPLVPRDAPAVGSYGSAGRVRPMCGCPTTRSEEHTSELQSPCNLVCRLLLEKKNNQVPDKLFDRSCRRRPAA